MLATTATANTRVVTDVADQLGVGLGGTADQLGVGLGGSADQLGVGLGGSADQLGVGLGGTADQLGVGLGGAAEVADGGVSGGGPLVLRGSLDRQSLRLAVLTLPTPAHRLGWLAERLADLPGSGIVYTLTVAAAEQTAEFLRGRGYAVASYTGQSEDADRRAAEEDLLGNRLKALVATSALGMGFDKPDLGFVVHLGAPPSPIAYYQQVGRAGRAVDEADVLLLPGREDQAIWRYFAGLAFPPADQVRDTLAALAAADRPLSTAALEPRVELRRSRLEMMLKVLDVDGAVRRVQGGWVTTGQEWSYDSERLARVAQARAAEQQSMLDYQATTGCRLEFLRRCLDDPQAEPCGRCDRCAGARYPVDVGAAALDSARSFLGRPGVEIAPRRLWPTGLPAVGVPFTGKIAAGEQSEPGRAVARLSDLGWGDRLRVALADRLPGPRRTRGRAGRGARRLGEGSGRLVGAAGGRGGRAVLDPPRTRRQPGRADRPDRPAPAARLGARGRSAGRRREQRAAGTRAA